MKLILFIGIFLFYIFIAIVTIFHIGGMNHDLFRNILFDTTEIVPIVAGLYSIRMFGLKSFTGKALLFIICGFSLVFLGGVIYTINKYIFGIVKFPSAADVPILLGYPLVLVGLIVEIITGKVRLLGRDKLFFIFMAVVLGGVVAYFEIYRGYNPDAPFIESAVTMLYGVIDIVLIVSTLLIINLVLDYVGGKLLYPWITFFFGVLMLVLGDIIFAIKIIEYQEQTGYWYMYIDLTWMAGYLLIGMGLIQLGTVVRGIQTDILKKTSLSHK